MNDSITSEFTDGLIVELRMYHELCEIFLALAARENQVLADKSNYQPLEFHQERKNLLPDLLSVTDKLRHRRMIWQNLSQFERECCHEIKPLFQSIQSILMKVLLLDRENQQAMLRCGLVPARHLPADAVQKPHFVATLYQRNSVV